MLCQSVPCSVSFCAAKPGNSEEGAPSTSQRSSLSAEKCDPKHKDCLLREFRKLCAMVADKPSYNVKTQIIQDFLQKGTGGGMVCVVLLLMLVKV